MRVRLCAGSFQQLFVARFFRRAFLHQGKAMLPFHFNRRGGKEQRAGKAFIAKACFLKRFAGSAFGHGIGDGGCGNFLGFHEINRTGNYRVEPIGWKTSDLLDAGLAGCQRFPVFLLALAEGRDHAHAGYGDQRSAKVIGVLHGHWQFSLLRKQLPPWPCLRRGSGPQC